MKKNDTLKKKKWLKARTRVNRMKKHHNKGIDPFTMRQNQMLQAEKDARERAVEKEIAKAMGLNSKDVI